ncbi:MAG: response regulator transcription factor [Gammaproteobacteria bacterium]|nr:response regulator transcription factor [Gammaproteobacteria bacterium]
MRLLVVDAHAAQGRAIKALLEGSGYEVTYVDAYAAAYRFLLEGAYQCVVLAVMSADGRAIDVLKSWRRNAFSQPVLILSNRASVNDTVTGLDSGADDFLTEPYAREELLARIRSLVRRHARVKSAILECRGVRLDVAGRVAEFCGDGMVLTSPEFAILQALMENRGLVISRETLYERIWPERLEVNPNLLDVYIHRLRRRFRGKRRAAVIQTVRGRGYRLV